MRDRENRGQSGATRYRYDGHGRRVQNWRATEPGTLSMYTQAGTLIYDQNERATGRKYSDYVYLGGSLIATRALNIDTNIRTVAFSHTDALGSPVAVTNEAGQVVDRTAYQPWGRPIGKPQYDGIGYTGHVRDGATQLTYMQQRYHDETIGRFLSVDPVTAYENPTGAFNRYWYANNNPYKFKDPDGRYAESIIDIGLIVADIADISSNGLSWTNGASLAANVVGLAVPVGTGFGPAVRGVAAGVDTARGADRAADASRATGSLKNRSGNIEASANAARSNPYPRQISGHANQRLQTRDKAVTPQAMEKAAVAGKRTLDPATGKTRHDLPASASPTGRGVTVVTNPKGSVVTVIDKGRRFSP
jgi:RHS repeat-associated protein